jgi:hypothetical protein
MNTAKILRSIGSGIFLAVTFIFNACLVITYIMNKRKELRHNASSVSGGGAAGGGKYASSSSNSSATRIHPTLPILSLVGSFLIVRGVFGLLQSAVWSVSRALTTLLIFWRQIGAWRAMLMMLPYTPFL